MSNAIRFDSLLLAATARALNKRLAGRAVRGIWIDRKNRALLVRLAATTRRQPDSWLSWTLHPTAGDLRLDDAPREPVGSTVQVAPGTSIRTVRTLPDERVLVIELNAQDAAAGFARRVIIELIGSRWNAIATGDADVIIALMQSRVRNDIAMLSGVTYVAPPQSNQRAGAQTMLTREAFEQIFGASNTDEDIRRTLIQNVAYTSPLNATYIVAPIVTRGGVAGMAEAYARYATLYASDDAFVLREGRGQPYPSSLGHEDVQHASDMIDAFANVDVNADASMRTAVAGSADAAMAGVHERIRRIDERVARLRAESDDAEEESSRMRRQGDLLFAQLHRVARGVTDADLDDFEGGTVHVALDASLSAKDNATRLHEQAKRRADAAARVPAMIARARAERARLASLQEDLANGTASAADIDKWSREALQRTDAKGDDTPSLPYRVYHTSSGIEVRVGRNSRANDALTTRHAKPDDIWLHARDYAGAHVVMRWTSRDANPSARDLEEAAIIAAVNSRGRTSSLVPVDWTRRKYVRKPRKAPAGNVLVERSKTLFVRPDAALEKKLRYEDV